MSTQGEPMAEVTEADVLRARELLDSAGHRHEFTPTLTATIAAALAEERTRAYNRGAIDGMKLAREHREVTE